MGPLLVLGDGDFVEWFYYYGIPINICVERVGRKDPQDLTQFSPRSHPRHLVGKRGWSGGAMVLGKLPVPGRPTILIQ